MKTFGAATANACLFMTIGAATIVAITINAAIVVVFFFIFVWSLFVLLLVFFQPWIECYLKVIIKTVMNSICGIHIWNPDLEFVSFFISSEKQNYAMKIISTTQHRSHQQKVNSNIKCHSSALEIEESVPKKDKQKKGRKKKILIVDDEPDITYTLSKVLEVNGFSGLDVYNEPLLALQNFKSHEYGLLITDIAMPKMNGFELYEQIKKIDAEIKVIFMTASNINYKALSELLQIDIVDSGYENKKMILFQDEEGSTIIRKPVEIMEFIQTVNNQLQTIISQPIEEKVQK